MAESRGGFMGSKGVLRVVSVALLFMASTALAQERGVFVTPIANAPFMAVVTEQRTTLQSNGTSIELKRIHAIARNNARVIYNENRPLTSADSPQDSAVTVSHIYDPQTRLNTFLYPQRKTYQQRRLARPASTEPPDSYATPEASSMPASQFTEQKDLGSKTMEGVSVHGVLITQHLPVPNQAGQDVTVTDEYWYSPDLRLNMLIKHNNPISGSTTMTVTQVSRTEPDEAIFQIPGGYQPLERLNAGSR